jgi:metal-responsive CopG/Arc/MetJ family transcriptional regulator
MANVKTAISLEENLFQQIETLAREMNVSRSRLFVMALEDFLKRKRRQQLLDSLNAVYSAEPALEDKKMLDWALAQQRKRVEQDKW